MVRSSVQPVPQVNPGGNPMWVRVRRDGDPTLGGG